MQRKAPRRDYKLFFVQRRAPRHDYKLFLCSGKPLAATINSFLCSGKLFATTINAFLCSGKLFAGKLMTRAIREMVGAVPVCPPERPHSGVSIRKGNVPSRKGAVSIHKRCMLTPKHVCAFADGCALAGRRGRAHRHRPSTSIKPLYHVIFLDFVMLRTILRQSYNTNHTRNGRGGACVPARTSAQRRFHQQRARPYT